MKLQRTVALPSDVSLLSALRPMSESPYGVIGRRARPKIEFRKECWFDSGQARSFRRGFGRPRPKFRSSCQTAWTQRVFGSSSPSLTR